ncbi:MAG: hypothetical protein CBC13_05700 [Planctomycetia bacterium TMED53]|nr:MAG: hypothetical protein CBC13_05700 [Planctomycetia bacterium TMED53]
MPCSLSGCPVPIGIVSTMDHQPISQLNCSVVLTTLDSDDLKISFHCPIDALLDCRAGKVSIQATEWGVDACCCGNMNSLKHAIENRFVEERIPKIRITCEDSRKSSLKDDTARENKSCG